MTRPSDSRLVPAKNEYGRARHIMTLDTQAEVALLGIDTPIGLTIIRELGQAGIRVHGIGRNTHAIGRCSRYLASAHVRPEGDDALVNLIRSLQPKQRPLYVMTISEGDILLLARLRDALAPAKCLVPDSTRMAAVLDKSRTLAAAEDVGIAVPRSWTPTSPDDTDLWDDPRLQLPVVLKWSDPHAVQQRLRRSGLALVKAQYCLTRDELRTALASYAAIGAYPLVQEYCPGYGLGQFVFMKGNEALLTFQHRRLHEWPPEGGFSSMCESLPATAHPELMERSIALLRSLRWEGPAMVEYRFDPATQSAKLMEVNGRFWGSLPLAYHAGAPFALYTYAVLGNQAAPPLATPRAGIRCRFAIPETKRLLRILFQRDAVCDPSLGFSPIAEVAGYLAGFFDPRMRYFVWSLKDPLPFFSDLWGIVAQRLKLRHDDK